MRRVPTFILALAAAGAITTPALAGAQTVDAQQTVDLCRPQLASIDQLDPWQATFTIPDTCPPGVKIRYSANLVLQPCGLTPAGQHVCTLPDDYTIPWHDGLAHQQVISAGVHDATPGDHLMPLVDPCHAPGQLLQLDLGVIPTGGDEINVAHRYVTCDSGASSSPPVQPLGHVDCTAGGLPTLTFTAPQTGVLHVTFGTPNGPAEFAQVKPDVAVTVTPAVGPAADRALDVLAATVVDDQGVTHPAQLVESTCYIPPLLPVSDTPSVSTPPAGDVPPAPPAGEGTQASGGQDAPSPALPAAAAPDDAVEASSIRKALPTTGARQVGLLASIGFTLIAAGVLVLRTVRALKKDGQR